MKALLFRMQAFAGRPPASLLLGLPFLANCALRPAHTLETPYGVVRASREADLESLAADLLALYPVARAAVPHAADAPLEVRVMSRIDSTLYARNQEVNPAGGAGYPSPGGTTLASIQEDYVGDDRVMLHELLHTFLGRESWRALPLAVNEGLAELLDHALLGAEPGPEEGVLLATALGIAGGYDFRFSWMVEGKLQSQSTSMGEPKFSSLDELCVFLETKDSGLSVAENHRLEGFGYFLVLNLVERFGLEKLHELCLRAEQQAMSKVPMRWFLDLLGWSSLEDVRRDFRNRYTDREIAALLWVTHFDDMMLWLDWTFVLGWEEHPYPTAKEFLEKAQALVQIFADEPAFPLSEVPGILELLESAW